MPFTHALMLFISLCLLFVSSQTLAESTSIETLQQQNKLKVIVSLEKTESIVPNQQLVLNVDLLSEGAFNGTVKVEYLDIDNAIVIQPDGQTEIKTKEVDGQQWFIQREKISVYPRKAGNFKVPEITLKVTMNDQSQANRTGKIKSEPYQFEVSEPEALKGLKDIVVSPKVDFTLSQIKQNKEQAYQVGDAITYVYETKAQKMHVLLLSELTISDINGVQMYRKPVVEKDDFDRFEKFNTASIKQEITFIFEKEGSFTLPEQRLTWWDSNKGQLQDTVIKAQTIVVGEGASFLTKFNPLKQFKLTTSSALLWLSIAISALLLILVIWQIYRHKNSLLATFYRFNKSEQKELSKSYNQHINDQNYQQAINCLYELVKLNSGSVSALSTVMDNKNIARLNTLKELAFNGSKQQGAYSKQEAELLLEEILKQPSQRPKTQPFKFSVKLNSRK